MDQVLWQIVLVLVVVVALLALLRVERARYVRGASPALFQKRSSTPELSQEMVLEQLSPVLWMSARDVVRAICQQKPGAVVDLFGVRRVLIRCANIGMILVRMDGKGDHLYKLQDHHVGKAAAIRVRQR